MGYADQCAASERSADDYFKASFFEILAKMQTLGYTTRLDFLDFGGVLIEVTKNGKSCYCESSSSLEYLIYKTKNHLKMLIGE